MTFTKSEHEELTELIDEEVHVDWFSGSSAELALALLSAGYRKRETE